MALYNSNFNFQPEHRSNLLATIARNSRPSNRQSNEISKLSLAFALPNKSSSEDAIDIQNSTLNEIRGDYLRP